MGRRRRDGQEPGREELVGVAGGVATTSREASGNVSEHLLSLQLTHGNRAVATIVQRKGNKAASTDAPGYKKPKEKKGPPAKKEENFAPSSPRINGTLDVVKGLAYDYWEGKNGKSMDLDKAAIHMEDVWLRTDAEGAAKAVALNVARIWKENSEPKRYAFWMKVHSGEIKPKAPKPEPGSDRHF